MLLYYSCHQEWCPSHIVKGCFTGNKLIPLAFVNDTFSLRKSMLYPEEVLSFAFRPATILYGMSWAMMVAAEACQASSVVVPFRNDSLGHAYVSNRTHLPARATVYALVAIDMKRFVSDKAIGEKATDDAAVHFRPIATVEPEYPCITMCDFGYYFIKPTL